MTKIDIDNLYTAADRFRSTALPKGSKADAPCTAKELTTAVNAMYNMMVVLLGELKNLE